MMSNALVTDALARRVNMGHENAKGMAYVGVRVGPTVRLVSVATDLGSHDASFFKDGNDLLTRSINETAFSKDDISVVGAS